MCGLVISMAHTGMKYMQLPSPTASTITRFYNAKDTRENLGKTQTSAMAKTSSRQTLKSELHTSRMETLRIDLMLFEVHKPHTSLSQTRVKSQNFRCKSTLAAQGP
jgi:hypothetical protein